MSSAKDCFLPEPPSQLRQGQRTGWRPEAEAANPNRAQTGQAALHRWPAGPLHWGPHVPASGQTRSGCPNREASLILHSDSSWEEMARLVPAPLPAPEVFQA